jgi:hypothetical protein
MKRLSRDVGRLTLLALVVWLLAWLACGAAAGVLRWLLTAAGSILLGLLLLAVPMVCFGLFVCVLAVVVSCVGSGVLTGAEKVARLVERRSTPKSGAWNGDVVPAPGPFGRGDEVISS